MTNTWRGAGVPARGIVTALALAAMIVASIGFAPRASAQEEFDITIPVTTVVRDVGVGTTVLLQTRDVPESATGQLCEVTAKSRNQESVHEGNNLIVASDGTSAVLADVEAVPLGEVEGQGIVILGSEITVSLVMGPEDLFSAGIDVFVDCSPEEPLLQSITVVKAEADTNSDATFTFNLDGSDIGGNVVDESVELGFGESFTWELFPGDYSLAEVEHADLGLISAVCDNGDDPAEISLAARENVTCTFENEAPPPPPPSDVLPEIAVDKTARPEAVEVPGADVTFEVVISNPSDVEDVEITSIQDDVFGTLSGDEDCQVGTILAPGGSCEFDFVGAVQGEVGDLHVNTVTVVGVDEEGNQVSDEDDATVGFTEVEDIVIVAVTVAGSCEFDDDGEPIGILEVEAPEGVAEVVISQGGEVVASFSESGQATVALEQSYDWTATAEDGFELAETSGSVFVSGADCPTEVEDVDLLPFTGQDSDQLALIALGFLGGGFLIVRLARPGKHLNN